MASTDFYNTIVTDLDSVMSSAIRKHLKKCARARETNKKGNGSILDDWASLKKAYQDALQQVLKGAEDSMQIGGVLKYCNYVPVAEEEED